MKIAIGTLNKAKSSAIQDVFSLVFKDCEFWSIATDSGVKAQPLSDSEAIQGAENRAKQALEKVEDADFGIGAEGTVDENEHGMFLCGWVVILHKSGKKGIGGSPKILLPESFREKIKSGMELSAIIRELYNDEKDEIRHSQGTIGILTDGMCTRVDQFKTATACALAPFLHEKLY